jgi:hypothetical protein
MQFVQIFQVSHCRYLQDIEIIVAGIAKVGDVTIEHGSPAIILPDTAVTQRQANAHAPSMAREVMSTSQFFQRKTDEPFRSAIS